MDYEAICTIVLLKVALKERFSNVRLMKFASKWRNHDDLKYNIMAYFHLLSSMNNNELFSSPGPEIFQLSLSNNHYLKKHLILSLHLRYFAIFYKCLHNNQYNFLQQPILRFWKTCKKQTSLVDAMSEIPNKQVFYTKQRKIMLFYMNKIQMNLRYNFLIDLFIYFDWLAGWWNLMAQGIWHQNKIFFTS